LGTNLEGSKEGDKPAWYFSDKKFRDF